MRFGAPGYFWLLLLLPLTSALIAWSLVARRRALARFADWALAQRLVVDAVPGRQVLKGALFVVGLLLVVLAVTRPQFGAKLSMAEQRGVDVVIALDVSRSMLAEDVRPNRLERASFQIRALLDRLGGNRVGLVFFAGKAFVQCPLTLDFGAVEMLLDLADTGAIPVQGTALGDALRASVRCFDQDDTQHKVIVLFTDGEDHLGDPLEAAREAAATGVRVYTVGLGSASGELIPVRGEQGGVSFHRDKTGNPVKTRLDEAALEQIALSADGDYYRSTLGGDELEALADQIAGMDRKDLGSRRLTQYEERYQVPLALGLVCLLTEALLGDGRSRRQEWRGRFA
jgi:Ca-activated chloride channel homolog